MGVVADRDDQVSVVKLTVQTRRNRAGQVKAVARGNGDRPWVDPGGGMGTGRASRHGADAVPSRGRELRAGGVGGAHEEQPTRSIGQDLARKAARERSGCPAVAGRSLGGEAVRQSDVVITMGCGDTCPFYPANGMRTGCWTTRPARGSRRCDRSETRSAGGWNAFSLSLQSTPTTRRGSPGPAGSRPTCLVANGSAHRHRRGSSSGARPWAG